MQYNWEHPNWPQFEYSLDHLQPKLYQYAKDVGRITGILKALDTELSDSAILQRMVDEALYTSRIEGETFHETDIRSSIQNYLHPEIPQLKVGDARAIGVARLMTYLYKTYPNDLSEAMLLEWHAILFEHRSYAYLQRGCWRQNPEPMQIVSGPIGREKVYFEAPPAHTIPEEMRRFIQWFNSSQTKMLPGPIRAGIAHLYFESIHPFEDGNGRIGRAISELALSQDMQYPCVFSLSKAIQHTHKQYYEKLAAASSYTLNATEWLTYFVEIVIRALQASEEDISFILKKARFWKKYEDLLNSRQVKVIQRILQEGRVGFKGGINARKYMKLTECSKATATRDLSSLLEMGALVKMEFGGRSTAYDVVLV